MHPNCWTGACFPWGQIPETPERRFLCILLCCHTYANRFIFPEPDLRLPYWARVKSGDNDTTRVKRKMSQGWGRPQFSRLSHSHLVRSNGKWAVWDAARRSKQWRANEGAAHHALGGHTNLYITLTSWVGFFILNSFNSAFDFAAQWMQVKWH